MDRSHSHKTRGTLYGAKSARKRSAWSSTQIAAPQPFDDCYDGYGRLLAYIRIGNGNDLAEELLAAGLARVYRYQNEIYDRMDAYYAAQSQAQDRDLGILVQLMQSLIKCRGLI